ncbi:MULTISPECIES: L-rhamnose mutarotase [unclassified Halomonas]|uniref:L-rhamnose mutarotase n=1 Tax=unclassified Halomonas TaxID=2609666 RepID=UPI0007D963C0|nr:MULTISPECIES: L-rhamnose mutarotase [unclassified Halomonas]MBT2787172.1 L-rhamnose mutarotase [Halomonas sp. ISL-106]MBT2795514.1 L-rhamnose mutarotase [Halomonas sp. ISL-104]OAL58010.1 L-rhamnose mutarotase [Halomonas sp. ALS9]
MLIKALRMTLYPGQADEYQRRHEALWPELSDALADAGIEEYRIFLDPRSHHLFAIMVMRDDNQVDQLAELPVMQRWWAYMADIMETENDHSPVSVPLDEVFAFLPGEPSCK